MDVIIPVYRGLEDTQRSVLSALASPCQTAWHLVVINDCSPEPEVTQWLREIAAQEPRIILLENEENLGFVATVNRGMRLHPDRDPRTGARQYWLCSWYGNGLALLDSAQRLQLHLLALKIEKPLFLNSKS